MKNINPFYFIGTVGMIVTATLHIFLSLTVNDSAIHPLFFVLYPNFIAFLAIGFGQLIKAKKTL